MRQLQEAMRNRADTSLAIIVRTTGESTTQILMDQLRKQLSREDSLNVIDKNECFEDKLKHGFELGFQAGKSFTVFIDADILVRSNIVKAIKKNIRKLEDTDLGFGLRLWDRFYDKPKFRGLHIYRTDLLEKAIQYIPEPNLHLRPESFTKEKLKEVGHVWRNDITYYVAGIHDFYQTSDDIYYKFVVRSKRSEHELNELKHRFRLSSATDFKIALKGIEDGEQMDSITNNKFLYKKTNVKLPELDHKYDYNNQSIDMMILKRLVNYYHFNRLFWSSI